MYYWFFCCLVSFLYTPIFANKILYEGDDCKVDNENGKCVSIQECDYAKNLLKADKRPQHCGFKRHTPIVCCLINQMGDANNVKSGNISSQKCREYYKNNENNLRKDALSLIIWSGGQYSKSQEFPHMVLLGYGEENDTQWLCGGTLISERFVLTAAHCLESQSYGKVRKIRLGELDIKTTTDDAKPQDYGIAEIFAHPNYTPPSHYNDIALLKLEKPADFNSYVKPACLHTEHAIPRSVLIGTGWGKTNFVGDSSSHLIKAFVDYVPHDKCAKRYADTSTRLLKDGIIDKIQICAGSEDGRDACQGDSGGPLQIKIEETSVTMSHYSVVGITSFGKACGVENSVGVYTRVAPYIAWIENIVWS